MTAQEMDQILTVLTEASPRSIFLEVAFLESWVESHEKRMVGIPLYMVEAALPFLEEEAGWKPRYDFWEQPRVSWARMAAAWATYGALASVAQHQ